MLFFPLGENEEKNNKQTKFSAHGSSAKIYEGQLCMYR